MTCSGVPSVGKFKSVGVAQAVGMDPLVDAGLACQPWQEGTNVGRLHRPPCERTEHRRTAVDADGGPAVQPELQDCPSAGVQADNAVMVALAMQDADRAGLGVQVLREQGQALR